MESRVSQRIKIARKQVGYSQSDLAEELNVTPSAVYYWENNKRRVTTSLLKKIAHITGKPLSFFYNENSEAEIEETIEEITKRVNKLTGLLTTKEGEYKRLFEMAPFAIMVCNEDQILDVNRMACELFEYRKKEFLQTSLFSLIPKNRLATAKKNFKMTTNRKRRKYKANTYLTKNKKIIYCKVRTTELSTEKYIAIIIDVTKQIADKKKLQQSEKNFRILFESAPNGIIMFDKNRQNCQKQIMRCVN